MKEEIFTEQYTDSNLDGIGDIEKPDNLPEDLLAADRSDLADKPAYYKQIYELSLLTAEEEAELIERIDQGDEEAYETFFLANLRLVAYVANKQAYKAKQLEVDDLIAEGNLGLMRAIEDFDPSLGYKFSTYAYNWIWSKIDIAIKNQDRTIRLPAHALEKVFALRSKERELTRELDRQPTEDEIAERLGINEDKLRYLQNMARRLVSLDKTFDESDSEEDGSLLGIIPDTAHPDPLEELIRKEDFEMSTAKKAIADVLDSFDDRQRYVIEQRHGLNGAEAKTLEQVAAELGITRERVRQIQDKTERELIPLVRLQLARQGLMGEAEGTLTEQELPSLNGDRPLTFRMNSVKVQNMVELAKRLYVESDLELVEDFLERHKESNWFSKNAEAELLNDAEQYDDCMDILRAEYMGLALIAAAPYVRDHSGDQTIILETVQKAFEDVIRSDADRVTGTKLRNRIFDTTGAAAQQAVTGLARIEQAA